MDFSLFSAWKALVLTGKPQKENFEEESKSNYNKENAVVPPSEKQNNRSPSFREYDLFNGYNIFEANDTVDFSPFYEKRYEEVEMPND